MRVFIILFALTISPVMAEVRTWTNLSGVEIRAEFVSRDGDKITIRKDGNEFKIQVDTLSETDRKWLAAKANQAAAGEGIYIAVGNGLHRMSSTDGRSWTNHEFADKPGHDQNDLKSIAVGNGICVAVGGFSKSNILTTTDGVAWHKNAFNIGVLSEVMFRDGKFIVFGESGRIASSVDGMEWESIGEAKFREHLNREAEERGVDKPIKSNIRSWREAGGLYIGSGDNGFVITTRDFENWSFPKRVEPQSRLYIETDGNSFVVKGDKTLHHSTDGETWNNVTPEDAADVSKFMSIVHDGERYVVNDRNGRGWESGDGIKWQAIKGATFPGAIEALSPKLYYSFELYWKYTEDFKVSTDGGKSWGSCVIPAPAGVTNVIFAEGLAFP